MIAALLMNRFFARVCVPLLAGSGFLAAGWLAAQTDASNSFCILPIYDPLASGVSDATLQTEMNKLKAHTTANPANPARDHLVVTPSRYAAALAVSRAGFSSWLQLKPATGAGQTAAPACSPTPFLRAAPTHQRQPATAPHAAPGWARMREAPGGPAHAPRPLPRWPEGGLASGAAQLGPSAPSVPATRWARPEGARRG